MLLYEKKVTEWSFLLTWCSKPQSSPLHTKNVQAPFKCPSHTVAPLTQVYICKWETIKWGVDRHGITSDKHAQHDCTHTSGVSAVLASAVLTDGLLLQKSCSHITWWQMHHSSIGKQSHHFPCAPKSPYSLDLFTSVDLLEKVTPNMRRTLYNFQNSAGLIHLSSSFPLKNGEISPFFFKSALYPQFSVGYRFHSLHILNLLLGDLLLCWSKHPDLIYPLPNGHRAQC